MNIRTNHIENGQPLSPGLAKGSAFIYRDILYHHHQYYVIEAHDVPREIARLQRAMGEVVEELELAAQRVEQELDQTHGDILRVQQTMIQDPKLFERYNEESMVFQKRLKADRLQRHRMRKHCREKERVAAYYLDDHPAIWRLLQQATQRVSKGSLEICGELANRTDCLQSLLELGIYDFSIAPLMIPALKHAVRHLSTSAIYT